MLSPLDLLDDVAFDERLPVRLQIKADMHFTPVGVARRVARWLAPEAGVAVLDIGAGVGKFCLVAAHAAPEARFVGVELREELVSVATRLANDLGLSNVEFVAGDAFELDWSEFDAYYLYNPFAEQMFEHAFVLDRNIELAPSKFRTYVDAAIDRLVDARVGTRVVTYHGFGGELPASYELVAEDHELEYWVKTGVE